MNARNRRLHVVIRFVVLAGLGLGEAAATPRYATRCQQNCQLCHDNPTGGGKRSAYAAQLLVPTELSAVRWADEVLERLDPQLSSALSIGADMRMVYTYSPEREHRDGFFQMQATWYALLQPVDRLSLYLAHGQSQTREAFGVAWVLPYAGYVKIGRFTPPFGWKFDDHTHAVRERLGFTPPAHTDVGVEVGAYPGALGVQLSLTNGAAGLIQDADHRLAGTGRVDVRGRVWGAPVTFGGSLAHHESDAGVRRTWGFFASARVGPVTWLGEGDVVLAPLVGGADALVLSHELIVDVARGVGLRGVLDFFDPDVNAQTGATSRLGVGVDTLINPMFGLQAMLTWYEKEAGPATAGEDVYVQPIVIAHVLF
jgi:hypothetical protein